MKNINKFFNFSNFININGNIFKGAIKALLPVYLSDKIKRVLNKDSSVRIYCKETILVVDKKNSKVQGLEPVFYWDDAPNFGDVIGPFLVSNIVNKPVVNIYRNNLPGLITVGSIFQEIDRKGMVVWGSGLIDEPSKSTLLRIKKNKPTILSLRGKETARVLANAGINIPDENSYGDPALLLPLFYTPKESKQALIGLCPHYIHKKLFASYVVDQNGCKIIDVQKDLQQVVDEIVSSDVCISTSLHGLIIAQSYGIPWVWLEIVDDNLVGNDFKFRDFFSTIDESQVSRIQVKSKDVSNLDYASLAESAKLPSKRYDESLMLGALQCHLKNRD
tara:strand:- start:5747 stop:6745 length:999 start_codon:yes stop_codon:yes gene_type:complete